jgi:hypothetical protein
LDGTVFVPPIDKVAPLDTVKVPPAAVLLAVKLPNAKVPAEILKFPRTLTVPASVFVPDPEMVKCP